jgi:anaerobic dimethyl sulfoxide reductase subunit C (anchor subunit)
MPCKEWSLIVNSLMIQLAAGVLTFLALFQLVSGSDRSVTAISAPWPALIGPAILLGMMVSLFHLGHPFRAYRATTNLRTSWLSREVLFTTTFFVLWLCAYLLEKKGHPSAVMTWAAAGAGLLSVLSMSGIYSTTPVKGWHGLSTHVTFFTTTMVLGIVGASFIELTAGQARASLKEILLGSTLTAFIIVAGRVFHQLRWAGTMQSTDEPWDLDHLAAASSVVSSKAPVVARYQILVFWAGALSLTGIGLSFYIVLTNPSNGTVPAAAAITILLTGEFLGRAGFYSLWHESAQKRANFQSDRDPYGRFLRT